MTEEKDLETLTDLKCHWFFISNSQCPLKLQLCSVFYFQTFMLHKLFEEGKLRLDDPVNLYEPEFSVKNPFNKEQITLR